MGAFSRTAAMSSSRIRPATGRSLRRRPARDRCAPQVAVCTHPDGARDRRDGLDGERPDPWPSGGGDTMRKLTVLVAGGIGYVLGTRAGRERYDQIRGLAEQVKNNPKV